MATRRQVRTLKPQLDLEHLHRVEGELRIEAAPNGIGLAESVLLAGLVSWH